MEKRTGWIGYLLYALILAVLFLYIRFPSESIASYLKSALARANPALTLSIGSVGPAFPLDLEFLDAEIFLKGTTDRPIIRAKDLSVRPELPAFLLGERAYLFRSHAYKGFIEGNVRLGENEADGPLTIFVYLKGLEIGEDAGLSSLLGRRVSGTVEEGRVRYRGKHHRPVDGTGDATFILSHGMVELFRPILGIASLRFDRVYLKMALKDRTVTLSKGEVDGSALKLRVSGNVFLRSNIMSSRLHLKGTLEPGNGLLENLKGGRNPTKLIKQGLKNLRRSFIIRGTLERPDFRFT